MEREGEGDDIDRRNVNVAYFFLSCGATARGLPTVTHGSTRCFQGRGGEG